MNEIIEELLEANRHLAKAASGLFLIAAQHVSIDDLEKELKELNEAADVMRRFE